jgi:lysozyme
VPERGRKRLAAAAALGAAIALPALGAQGGTGGAGGGGGGDGPHGIDVSHHSGAIDWPAVKAHGVEFVVVKATEGVDDPDPAFDDHWRALGELGIVRGAYHFYVTEDDPAEQARFFLSRAKLGPGDLAPVVDIELLGAHTGGDLAANLRRFLEIVEGATGARPIIYTAVNFWNAHLDASFGDYPLWIAEYEVAAPRLPKGWSEWHLWQFEDDSHVPGVEKDADRSRLGAGVDLASLRVAAPAAATGPDG